MPIGARRSTTCVVGVGCWSRVGAAKTTPSDVPSPVRLLLLSSFLPLKICTLWLCRGGGSLPTSVPPGSLVVFVCFFSLTLLPNRYNSYYQQDFWDFRINLGDQKCNKALTRKIKRNSSRPVVNHKKKSRMIYMLVLTTTAKVGHNINSHILDSFREI